MYAPALSRGTAQHADRPGTRAGAWPSVLARFASPRVAPTAPATTVFIALSSVCQIMFSESACPSVQWLGSGAAGPPSLPHCTRSAVACWAVGAVGIVAPPPCVASQLKYPPHPPCESNALSEQQQVLFLQLLELCPSLPFTNNSPPPPHVGAMVGVVSVKRWDFSVAHACVCGGGYPKGSK